jgi:hypothetical protein
LALLGLGSEHQLVTAMNELSGKDCQIVREYVLWNTPGQGNGSQAKQVRERFNQSDAKFRRNLENKKQNKKACQQSIIPNQTN